MPQGLILKSSLAIVPASSATLEAAELIFFPRLAFIDLLSQHPDLAINIIISLSKHLRHLAGIIEELSFKDVPQQLATYLISLRDSGLYFPLGMLSG